jgi:ATP-dependent Lon protease
MPISFAVDSITIDELATVLLPVPVIIAIDEVDIEYLLWERRRSLNADLQHAVLPTTSSANERILPVVVLGDIVIPPLLPVGPGDTVILPRASIPNRLSGIRPGRSYRAIQAARDSDHEVLVSFVPELEIANYRSSEPQQLPTVGVIARLEEAVLQPDGTFEVVLDVTTRATVTTRLQHDPYYLATCVPHPDPEVTSNEIPALMAAVKARVEAMARTLAPKSTPEQVEEALTFMRQIDHPGQLADFITYSPTFPFADRIAFLNTLDPVERLRLVHRKLGA